MTTTQCFHIASKLNACVVFLMFCFSAVCFFFIYVSFRAVASALWAFLSSRHSSALYCFYGIVSVLINKIFIHSFIQDNSVHEVACWHTSAQSVSPSSEQGLEKLMNHGHPRPQNLKTFLVSLKKKFFIMPVVTKCITFQMYQFITLNQYKIKITNYFLQISSFRKWLNQFQLMPFYRQKEFIGFDEYLFYELCVQDSEPCGRLCR